jgi:Tol biopolymer transport system component
MRAPAEQVAVGSLADPRLASQTANGDSWNSEFSADGRFLVFISLASNLTTNDSNSHMDVFLRDLPAGTIRLVSLSLAGNDSGDGDSTSPAVSADGRWVAFESRADNLVADDTNRVADIFARDLRAGVTVLVSTTTNGLPRGSGASTAPAISADGRYVAFESLATNLVSGIADTNAGSDVFLCDLQQRTTLLVSKRWDTNRTGNGPSTSPAFSADGSRLLFISTATNLVTGTTNTLGEIYVRDLPNAATIWVSRNAGSFRTALSNGVPATARFRCYNPTISSNGRYVAFKMVVDTVAVTAGILRHDLLTGSTDLVGTGVPGVVVGGNDLSGPVMSADGRFVAYEGRPARGVLPAGLPVIWLWDADTLQTTLVSVNLAGTGPAMGANSTGSDTPAISADGRFVAFLSYATNLVPSGANGLGQAFVRDLSQGRTRLVSLRRDGLRGGNGDAGAPTFSPDGRLVAFPSAADDLVVNDFNEAEDLFLRDLETDQTELVSIGGPSATAAGMSSTGFQGLSADGRRLAFTSFAPNLVANDTNNVSDVFVRDWDNPTNLLISVSADGSGPANGLSRNPLISADGQVVVFTSFASNLVPGFADTNQAEDVYARFLSGSTICVVPGAAAADQGTTSPSLSADGQYVAYQSRAALPTESATDANGWSDVYVRCLVSSTNLLASVNFAGTAAGNGPSELPRISPDARWVVFQSRATDLVDPPLADASWEFFARNPWDGTTRHLSAGLPPASPVTNTTPPVFSADSRTVVFPWSETNLYLHSFEANQTILVSSNGVDAAVSAEGRWVAFQSRLGMSTNHDIFVRDLQAGTNRLVSVNLDGTGGGNGDSSSPLISGDGRFVVFKSRASNLAANDTNGWTDVFLRDLVANTTLLVSLNAAGTAPGNRLSSTAVMAADGRTIVFPELRFRPCERRREQRQGCFHAAPERWRLGS